MNAVRSYCCASAPKACAASSKTIFGCLAPLFFGFGIGVMNATLRRSSRILFVGWPLGSSSQWRARVLVRRVQERLLEGCSRRPPWPVEV